MRKKFKEGDVVFIMMCTSPCYDKKRCIGSLREITGICDSKNPHHYFNISGECCHLLSIEARLATDREKFLYFTHGPYALKESGDGE